LPSPSHPRIRQKDKIGLYPYFIRAFPPSPMDIFYYSNLCPHSQKVIQFVVKHQLQSKLSCICVDKRKRDANNQTVVVLETGKHVMLPPNLQSVPAVLCVKKNYVLVQGTDPILEYFQAAFGLSASAQQLYENPYDSPANAVNRRPQAMDPVGVGVQSLTGNMGIFSETYTQYHLTPEDLAGDSQSRRRPMYGYTPVDRHMAIETPEDNWRPDKIASNMTVDVIQQQRNQEIPVVQVTPPSELYGGASGAAPGPNLTRSQL